MIYSPGDILFSEYRVVSDLGRGRYGQIYLVENLGLHELRALKILLRDLPGIDSHEYAEIERRFEYEARLGASLARRARTPHLLQVHRLISQNGEIALELEYAEGGSLRKLLDQLNEQYRQIPIEQAIEYTHQAAEGLAELHHLNLVHRDVKPSNLLLDQHGRVKVADFGLVQDPDMSGRYELSNPLPHPGTPAYMSPEQKNTTALLTSASDIYALGVVLFELLTGRQYAQTKPGTSLHSLRPEVPDWLEALLMRMLAKDHEQRPWDGSETASLLTQGRAAEQALQQARDRQAAAEALRRKEAEEKALRDAELARKAEEKRQKELAFAEAARRAREQAEAEHRQESERLRQAAVTHRNQAEAEVSQEPKYQPQAAVTSREQASLTSKPLIHKILPAVIGLSLLGMILWGVWGSIMDPNTPYTQPTHTAWIASATPTDEIPVEGLGDAVAVPSALPREQTLYFGGLQWGSAIGWNPYAYSNNAMAIAQDDNARVIMFETPYLFNMLDGQQYPLLADGPYTWNQAHTEITFKIKPAAKWSDGTPVTAEDVAYTWATHVKYNTTTGSYNRDFIDTIEAVDQWTVRVKAKLDGNGNAVNPLYISAYLSTNYVIQKTWTQKLEERAAGDGDAFIGDSAEDVVYSGPYHKFFTDDSVVVYIRDDHYWGQDASMWGKLPIPKYLAHLIFNDNAAITTALQAGEVDVSQSFHPNVQSFWLDQDLPISTYLSEAPYYIGASLWTAYYNLKSPGLDQVAVRKAIAIAVDYPALIANAMTNQSATFEQVSRSLMNPTPGEQAMFDHDEVKDLQWVGNDIEGAKKLLDAAGIVDTDGDGWREYDGQKLSYKAACPNGWDDWQAAMEEVATAGKKIGIEITTNFPEWAEYQTAVTKSDTELPAGYDIFMMWSEASGPTQPWSRIRMLMSSEHIGKASNWSGNWGQYLNPEADALIQAIPMETDPKRLRWYYTELVKIYLTDVPSFTLMYRPQLLHTVNESVWTNFPHQGDGTNPPVPPLNLIGGWSIAGLYNLRLVNP